MLNQVFEIAQDRKVSDIVFLGDVFQRRSDISTEVFNTIYFKFKKLSTIANLHIIVGNHDTDGEHVTIDTFEFAKLYKEPTVVDFEGVDVIMLPFGSKTVPKNGDICLGHVEVKNFKGYHFISGFDVSDFSHFRRVVLGHGHKFASHNNITYLGCSIQTSWSDKDLPTYCALFDGINLDLINLETPKFYEMKWPDIDNIVEGNYVRIKVSSREEAEEAQKKLSSLRVKFLDLVYEPDVRTTQVNFTNLTPDFEKLCVEWLEHLKKQNEAELLATLKEILKNAITKPRL